MDCLGYLSDIGWSGDIALGDRDYEGRFVDKEG